MDLSCLNPRQRSDIIPNPKPLLEVKILAMLKFQIIVTLVLSFSVKISFLWSLRFDCEVNAWELRSIELSICRLCAMTEILYSENHYL